jgi:hypothetical protein
MNPDFPNLTGWTVYAQSVVDADGTTFFLAKNDSDNSKRLGVLGRDTGFEGTRDEESEALLCPLSPTNASALRARLDWLRPVPLGLQTSTGCGDRLGLATPGHIRSVRKAGGIAPILAQQSIRENARTGRTPQQVVDDALWGVVQEGWREPWGADADHLKTLDDIDICAAAGYTFYTIDPGDHVDNEAHTASFDVLQGKIHSLPWDELEDTPGALHERYLDRRFEVEAFGLEFDQTTLARAAAKYGRAIAHTVCMYRHLSHQTQNFELEMSVDETETPTSAEEHFFIASELRRLGVNWVSLAPRYVGRFEKGVDYIGDLELFEADLEKHAAIARVLGPYKLSIHSGSDKFSIYPIIAQLTNDLVHLKTAGTSYLEAVRAVAQVEPALFREILTLAIERYPEDRATYHVSAELSQVPTHNSLTDSELPHLLDRFDAREVLHVTFGSALARYGEQLLSVLAAHEEAHYAALEKHFDKHLAPFAG